MAAEYASGAAGKNRPFARRAQRTTAGCPLGLLKNSRRCCCRRSPRSTVAHGELPVEVSDDLRRSRVLGFVQGVAHPDASAAPAEATCRVVAAVGAIVAPDDELIPWASIAGLGTHSGHAFVGVRLSRAAAACGRWPWHAALSCSVRPELVGASRTGVSGRGIKRAGQPVRTAPLGLLPLVHLATRCAG
jgi:hypothetical protein